MIEWLFYICFNQLVIELIFYFVVDKVTQHRFQNSKNKSQKRRVLLDGCVMMSVISFFIWLHHVPYIFLTTIFFTLVAILKLTLTDECLSWIAIYFHNFTNIVGNCVSEVGRWCLELTSNAIILLENFGNEETSGSENNTRTAHKPNFHPSLQFDKTPIKRSSNPTYPPVRPSGNYSPSLLATPERALFSQLHRNNYMEPRGLTNEGNLCFFNCVIQVLARTKYLTHELKKLSLYVNKMDSVYRELINVFEMLTESNYQSKPLHTNALRSALHLDFKLFNANGNCLIQSPEFGTQEEQDVAEFLTWILNVLDKSLKSFEMPKEIRKGSSSYNEKLELWKSYGSPDENEIQQQITFHFRELDESNLNNTNYWSIAYHIANLKWLDNWLKDSNATVVEDIFLGQSMILDICPKHNKFSVNVDHFKILNFALSSGTNERLTIKDYLIKLSSEEHAIDSSLHPSCPTCCKNLQAYVSSSPLSNRIVPSVKSRFQSDVILSPIRNETSFQPNMMFSGFQSSHIIRNCFNRLPNCLVLQLERLGVRSSKSGGETYKLRNRVGCDLQLDLKHCKPREVNIGPTRYSLYAIILHHSSLQFGFKGEGHYQAVVMTSQTTWHLFDDESVTLIKDIERYLLQPSVEENVYLLFYCKLI